MCLFFLVYSFRRTIILQGNWLACLVVFLENVQQSFLLFISLFQPPGTSWAGLQLGLISCISTESHRELCVPVIKEGQLLWLAAHCRRWSGHRDGHCLTGGTLKSSSLWWLLRNVTINSCEPSGRFCPVGCVTNIHLGKEATGTIAKRNVSFISFMCEFSGSTAASQEKIRG